MTTLGIHQERLELRLAEGLLPTTSPASQVPAIKSGSTVLGRALLVHLQSKWPETQGDEPRASKCVERIEIREKLRLPDHCMDSVLSQYLSELTATVAKGREIERLKQAEQQKLSKPPPPPAQQPKAAPAAPSPPSTISQPSAILQPTASPAKSIFDKQPPKPADTLFAPPLVESKSAAKGPADDADIKTISAQTPMKAYITAATLSTLKLDKAIQAIVDSPEYKESMQVRELLCIIALEAEGLPKKLARTMSSMAEQKNKLEKTLWKLRESGWATQTPALVRLSQLIKNLASTNQRWPESCDSVSFVFLNELLRNLVQAYLSQAHQASTVWSFSHFVALLLRSDGLKSVVGPLWEYNLHAHACATLGIWDNSATKAETEHVVRLHSAVLICEPNFDAAWTYLASLMNDISQDRIDLEFSLGIINACLGVTKVFLSEHFARDWPMLENVLRSHIIPRFKALSLKSEQLIRFVQLEEALRTKIKPEAYTLSAREKELTVD